MDHAVIVEQVLDQYKHFFRLCRNFHVRSFEV
jgi:hypothetical protein